MAGLDPKVLAGLDPKMFAGMDPKMLQAMMEPKLLSGMDPKALFGGLDPRLFGFDPKMFDPKKSGGSAQAATSAAAQAALNPSLDSRLLGLDKRAKRAKRGNYKASEASLENCFKSFKIGRRVGIVVGNQQLDHLHLHHHLQLLVLPGQANSSSPSKLWHAPTLSSQGTFFLSIA